MSDSSSKLPVRANKALYLLLVLVKSYIVAPFIETFHHKLFYHHIAELNVDTGNHGFLVSSYIFSLLRVERENVKNHEKEEKEAVYTSVFNTHLDFFAYRVCKIIILDEKKVQIRAADNSPLDETLSLMNHAVKVPIVFF